MQAETVKWLRPEKGRSIAMLGPLEAEMIDIVWARQQVTVRDVYEEMRLRRQLAYISVMTVMNNLVTKELLLKDRSGMAFVYAPAIPREEVIATVLDIIVAGLCGGECGTALAHLLGLEAPLSADETEELKECAQRLACP